MKIISLKLGGSSINLGQKVTIKKLPRILLQIQNRTIHQMHNCAIHKHP